MTAGMASRKAFAHLREGKQMAGLVPDAARCRSESDWLIGINGTRALTKRMFGSRAGNVAAVGRVQTPTLAIVYAQASSKSETSRPGPFWRVTASFEVAKGTYEAAYQRPNFKKAENDEHDRIDRIWDQAFAEKPVLAACASRPPWARRHRGKKSEQPDRSPPLRPHHPAAGVEQPLRALRPPHSSNRPGPLRAPQGDHLPAHRFAGPARRLHADGQGIARQRSSGDLAKHARPGARAKTGCAPTSGFSTIPRFPITLPSSPAPPSRSLAGGNSRIWKRRFLT